MTVRTLINTPATRANLDLALETVPSHLHPIIRAVRDHAVDMLFVPQGAGSFQLPTQKKRPVIFMIGDDLDHALGPQGFHLPSIRRASRVECHASTLSGRMRKPPIACKPADCTLKCESGCKPTC